MDAPTPGKRTCPKCGQSLAADALDGLCPGCLLGLNLADPTQLSGDGGHPASPSGFVPPPVDDLAPFFPQLEILELVGRGGMGAVYKARQKELDRVVALKILPPETGRDPAFADRFAREAKALARMNHPDIVTLYEFGRAGAEGPYYFLMEYVDGVSLGHLLRGGRIGAREALAIVPQICDALQYAHDHGIVHRDIKPENVLLDRQGRVKVADFGLAKIVRSADPAGPSGRSDPGAEASQIGRVLGTPPYMAPEQRERPSEVDHRADIYSLGVVFYQMLTGELPKGDLEPPSKKVVVDVRLDEVVLRALELKPELRYQQAGEVKTMVETIVHSPAAAATRVPGEAVKKSDLVRVIEILCNSTFTSPLAIRLANFSALGFLGFLASLGYLDPRLKPCFGLSGFFGLFGLIGFAVLVEMIARRRSKAPPGRDSHRARVRDLRGHLAESDRRTPLMLGTLSIVVLVALAVVFQARLPRARRVDSENAGEMRAETEAASADASPARVAFGPVIEREICFNSVKGSPNRFLDLDSGRFVTPPPEVEPDFATDEWMGRYYGLDSKEAGAAMQDWVRRSGADVLVDGGQKQLTLLGGWGFDQDVRDARLVEFDRADPAGTLRRLADIDEDMRNSENLAVRLSFLHPPGWYSDGRPPTRTNGRPQPHDTVLFRTAAGSMGILQFGGFRENPPRASVRYKLVQGSQGNAPPAAGPAAADEMPVFGPVIERTFGGDSFMWTNCWALNLASGKVLRFDLLRPPPDAAHSLATVATGQADYPLSLDRRMPSIRAAHVDLMQHMAASIPDMLLTIDMRLIRLSTNDWNLTAAEAAARLAPLVATVHDPAEETITGEYVYLFATRDGARGILQIMRETTHLRYKLILGGTNAHLASGFGPEIARELVAAPDRKEQEALDLDEGRVLRVPENLIDQNNPRGLLDWMVTHRLDLIVNNSPAEDFLGLHLDDGFLVRTPPQFAFDGIDVGDVGRHQAQPGPLQYVMLPKTEIKDQPVFLFQTREGSRGVLQITGFAPNSGTVKLRYKIVLSEPPPVGKSSRSLVPTPMSPLPATEAGRLGHPMRCSLCS